MYSDFVRPFILSKKVLRRLYSSAESLTDSPGVALILFTRFSFKSLIYARSVSGI